MFILRVPMTLFKKKNKFDKNIINEFRRRVKLTTFMKRK